MMLTTECVIAKNREKEKNYSRAVKYLQKSGIKAIPVTIDIANLMQWCRAIIFLIQQKPLGVCINPDDKKGSAVLFCLCLLSRGIIIRNLRYE